MITAVCSSFHEGCESASSKAVWRFLSLISNTRISKLFKNFNCKCGGCTQIKKIELWKNTYTYPFPLSLFHLFLPCRIFLVMFSPVLFSLSHEFLFANSPFLRHWLRDMHQFMIISFRSFLHSDSYSPPNSCSLLSSTTMYTRFLKLSNLLFCVINVMIP